MLSLYRSRAQLFAEMTRLGKRTAIKIYPPQGRTVLDGHTFAVRSPHVWQADVLAFITAAFAEPVK